MRFYLPPAVFLAFGLYARWRFGDILRNPKVVTHPENRVWHPLRLFDNAEWTISGRHVRRRYFRVLLLGLAASLAAVGALVAIS